MEEIDKSYFVAGPMTIFSRERFLELSKTKSYYELWRGLPKGLKFERVESSRRCESATRKDPALFYEGSRGYIWASPETVKVLMGNPESLFQARFNEGASHKNKEFDVKLI